MRNQEGRRIIRWQLLLFILVVAAAYGLAALVDCLGADDRLEGLSVQQQDEVVSRWHGEKIR